MRSPCSSFAISALLSFATLSVAQLNAIEEPIAQGEEVHVRRFAKLSKNGRPVKIQGMTHFGSDLYATTGVDGGLIYKINKSGKVSLWFNVSDGLIANGKSLDITSEMHGGLRAVAFHPKFKKNGLFYVSLMMQRSGFTDESQYLGPKVNIIRADSMVIEWKYDRKKTEVKTGSYREVLRIAMPVYDHPVKQMAFHGSLLYIGHGDGSVQSGNNGGGLNNDALGKVIRIDPTQKKKKKGAYSIPKNNPYRKSSEYLDELYAIGFRNPHTLCFSKKGELFVGDAGRDNVEEINLVKAGRNYGWPEREGIFLHTKSKEGGLIDSIRPLPSDDATNEYTYPVAVVGHTGPRGVRFNGQAIASGCPVENGSSMSGVLFYANFPSNGNLYYSFLRDMRNAKVKGKPSQLTQATTYKASILFDHDDDLSSPPLKLNNFLEVVRRDVHFAGRADVRFGQGKKGEIYVSSKTSGQIYVISSTVKGFRP